MKEKIEEKIVNEISKEFNKKPELIEVMLTTCHIEGYDLDDTRKILKEFYKVSVKYL